jgi:hypothetical protein
MLGLSDYARLSVHALDKEKTGWKRMVAKCETKLNLAVVSADAIQRQSGINYSAGRFRIRNL